MRRTCLVAIVLLVGLTIAASGARLEPAAARAGRVLARLDGAPTTTTHAGRALMQDGDGGGGDGGGGGNNGGGGGAQQSSSNSNSNSNVINNNINVGGGSGLPYGYGQSCTRFSGCPSGLKCSRSSGFTFCLFPVFGQCRCL